MDIELKQKHLRTLVQGPESERDSCFNVTRPARVDMRGEGLTERVDIKGNILAFGGR